MPTRTPCLRSVREIRATQKKKQIDRQRSLWSRFQSTKEEKKEGRTAFEKVLPSRMVHQTQFQAQLHVKQLHSSYTYRLGSVKHHHLDFIDWLLCHSHTKYEERGANPVSFTPLKSVRNEFVFEAAQNKRLSSARFQIQHSYDFSQPSRAMRLAIHQTWRECLSCVANMWIETAVTVECPWQSVRVVKESDSKSDGFARTGSNPVVVAFTFFQPRIVVLYVLFRLENIRVSEVLWVK
jgi:hypothetical protein